MITIKKYFLCSLMLNAMCLSAMDKQQNLAVMRKNDNKQAKNNDTLKLLALEVDIEVEKIRNRIDGGHLKVDVKSCCRRPKGSIMSYYKTIFLPQEDAVKEIQQIEGYLPINMPKEFNTEVFKKLVAQHWYVHYLTQALMVEKFGKFKNVTGSTIDKLHKPTFIHDISGRKEIVHNQAYKAFIYDSNIDQLVIVNPNLLCSDTHLSFLCLQAFWNNELNYDELVILKNSNSFKALDGLPRINLEILINKQLALFKLHDAIK